MSRRTLSGEEMRLWAAVAATVRLAPGRKPPPAPVASAADVAPAPTAPHHPPSAPVRVAKKPAPPPPERIEPGRERRITRERDPIDGRIDLHGMDYDRARAALHGFLQRQAAEGARAVLVITGKGRMGEGVLRRFTPLWLAEPAVRDLVAGVSSAHRRHGGEGALYVALKRSPPSSAALPPGLLRKP